MAAAGVLVTMAFAQPAFATIVDFEEFTGPSEFVWDLDNRAVTSKQITASGGQILTAPAGSNGSTVYGTTFGTCLNCRGTMSLSFDTATSGIGFTLFNAWTGSKTYRLTIKLDTGKIIRQDTVSVAGGASIDVAVSGEKISSITIFGLGGNPLRPFYVDDIQYDGPNPGYLVSLRAFIPGNNAPAGPEVTCMAQPATASGVAGGPTVIRGMARPVEGDKAEKRALYIAGDNRGFDPNVKNSRLSQEVALITNAEESEAGYEADSDVSKAGQVDLFAEDAVRGDRSIDSSDYNDDSPNDCSIFHQSYIPSTDDMNVDVRRINDHSVAVRFSGGLDLLPPRKSKGGQGVIDWDITVTLNTENEKTDWTVSGAHDGFPAFELYIDGKPIYRESPGDGPAYSFEQHVRKLRGGMDVKFGDISGEL